jgi:hypothetical protein
MLTQVQRVLAKTGIFFELTYGAPVSRLPYLTNGRYRWREQHLTLSENRYLYVLTAMQFKVRNQPEIERLLTEATKTDEVESDSDQAMAAAALDAADAAATTAATAAATTTAAAAASKTDAAVTAAATTVTPVTVAAATAKEDVKPAK